MIEDTTLYESKNPAKNKEMSDSAKIDSLVNTLGADTLNLAASGLPLAPPVKDTGEFLYPGHLLSKNLKGKVTFKIRIDQFGHVVDYQILGPSGELAIDSAATKALLESTFETSQFTDFSYLNIYFRYDIKFAPPKIDEFYNPYQKREETGP
jgi:outer membrane biosynthesis protein TonB